MLGVSATFRGPTFGPLNVAPTFSGSTFGPLNVALTPSISQHMMWCLGVAVIGDESVGVPTVKYYIRRHAGGYQKS